MDELQTHAGFWSGPLPKHRIRRTLGSGRRVRRCLMKCMLAALGVPALVVAAGSAQGGPDDGSAQASDQSFLAALNQAGIAYADAGEAVTAGHDMCNLVNAGESGSELVATLLEHNSNFTEEHARRFMAIALQTYCPQNLQKGMSEPTPEEQQRENAREHLRGPSVWPGVAWHF
ncbi:MAG TPA: DUF732 domain-containing protein [Mycobacterium sp.]